MTTLQTNDVRATHPQYDAFSGKWKKCRDAMLGQDTIHNAGIAYLPRLKEQTDADYNAYKNRTEFYNASWRTVEGFKGMIFRKPPSQKLPKGLDDLINNIDLKGAPLDELANNVVCDILEIGRIGLLVDYPQAPDNENGLPVTVAQAETLKLRPSIQVYAGESIINWKYRVINNETVLALVVLKEQVYVDDGEFGHKCIEQFRVLDLQVNNTYRIRLFQIGTANVAVQIGEDIVPLMNSAPLNFIPFVVIGTEATKADVQEPPMIDLVNLNLSHYAANADYKHGLHFTGLPTPWITGYSTKLDASGKPEVLYIGSQAAWLIQDAQAKVGYLEFTGQGLQSLRDYLDSCKQEMATLGARMLADTSIRQVETFGATAIKHNGENSVLAAVAISASRGLKIALDWFCEWAGQKFDVEYDLNRDFLPVQMDGPTLTAYIGAWQSGALSEQELFDNLKRGDIIEAEKTLEEHQAEIDSAPPPAPTATAEPGRLGKPTADEQATSDAEAAAKLAKAVPDKKPKKKAA